MKIRQYVITEPKMEQPPIINNVVYIYQPERYTDELNAHHWTTKWVYNNFIPKFSSEFNIPYNKSDFILTRNIVNGEDFSYFRYNHPYHIKYTQYDASGVPTEWHYNTYSLTNQFNNQILYHDIFIGAHTTCSIENLSTSSTRCLLLNCDSMGIPVVPLLVPYFQKIIHLDSRNHMDMKIHSLINWEDITDYVALFTSVSWFVHNKPYRQLNPYIK